MADLFDEKQAQRALERLKKPLPKQVLQAAFGSAEYPYKHEMKRGAYERQLTALQIELVKVQRHVRAQGLRVIALFEGRDAAGKGGMIKRFTAYMNPRYAHVAALTKPNEAERGQWYFQRYVARFPTAGDITFFDRSWYNRAGVERVFGFCTESEYERFLVEAPEFERMIQRDGIVLLKYWLTIGREMQLVRFHERATNPLKTWKLSPIDLASLDKWDAYTEAKRVMMRATHTPDSPWTVIKSNCKRRARLNGIRHFLSRFDYPDKDQEAIGAIDRRVVVTGAEEI